VGDYAFELAQHLALDADVHLFYSQTHGPTEPPDPRLKTLVLHPVGGYSLFAVGQITEELRHGDFDVVHIQYPGKGYGTSLGPGFIPQNLSGMKSRSRLCVTLHEWSTSHPLRRLVMDQMLKAVDAVLTTSPFEMESVATRARRDQRVYAIPVGNVLLSRAELDAVFDEQADGALPDPPASSGPDGRKPYSLFHFGLPARSKCLRRMLEALHILRENLGLPAHLFLAGDYSAGDAHTDELLALITEFELSEGVVKLGYLKRDEIQLWAEKYMLGVFPFEEGYSTKRSSIAALSEIDLPLSVGHGATEEHPYYAPEADSPEALAALWFDLLKGGLAEQWNAQVAKQREYGRRFRFSNIAQQHLTFYKGLRKIDA
jgi:hypothetical protein